MAQDYNVIAGNDLELRVTVTTSSGDAAPLGDAASAIYVISRRGVAVVSKTLAATQITVESTNVFVVDINGSDTQSLSGPYDHELRYVDALGFAWSPVYGTVNFKESRIPT